MKKLLIGIFGLLLLSLPFNAQQIPGDFVTEDLTLEEIQTGISVESYDNLDHPLIKDTKGILYGNEPSTIMGIHFWGSTAKNIMNGKTGWTVEVINTVYGNDGDWGLNKIKDNITKIRNEGIFEPIVRINKNWGATIPGYTNEYSAFAQACSNIVSQLSPAPYYIKYFIIGNEPNSIYENELGNVSGQGNAAEDYAQCFMQCYNAIKSATPSAKILLASPGNWALTAPVTRGGGSVYYDVYWKSVVDAIGNSADGYAIHTYARHTEGVDPYLQVKYQYANTWGFDSYKVLMQILKENLYAVQKTVFITETNTYHGYTDPQGSDAPCYTYTAGWLQESYNKIMAWNNASGNQKIKSICWFVFHDYGGWNKFSMENPIDNMNQARSDFSAITASLPPIDNCTISFSPSEPTAGQQVRVDITGGAPWVYVDLTVTGPSTATKTYLGWVANPDGTWTWSYTLNNLVAGTYTAQFTKDQGTLVCQRTLTVSNNGDSCTISFNPSEPTAGQQVRVDITGGAPWVYVDLTVTGPSTATKTYLGWVANPDGTWTWSYTLNNLVAGTYAAQFTKDQGTLVCQRTLVVTDPGEVDFYVGWIERLPHIDYVEGSLNPTIEGWPNPGQLITWRAWIKSTKPIKDVSYAWYLDGVLVKSGTVDLDFLTVLDNSWNWVKERHTLELKLDENNIHPEISEANNNLLIYTDALSLAVFVEKPVYDAFNKNQHLFNDGANSFDDFIKRNVTIVNAMFENAGVKDRIRVDAIIATESEISQDCPDPNYKSVDLQRGIKKSFLTIAGGNYTNPGYENPFYYFGGFWHEILHIRYLPDIYAIDVHSDANNHIDIMEGGKYIINTQFMQPVIPGSNVYYQSKFYQDLMNSHYNPPENHTLSQYTSMYLNFRAGYRAVNGNFLVPTDFDNIEENTINMLPEKNIVTLKGTDGQKLSNANVSVYQCEQTNQDTYYTKTFDNLPDIITQADNEGRVSFGKCPFDKDGKLEPYTRALSNGVMILRVEHNNQVGYAFFESTLFNIEYWKGNTDTAYYEIEVPLFDNSEIPTAPSNAIATAVSGTEICVSWVDNSNNEGGFEVNNGTTTVWVGANSTSYTWGGLANGTYMCFRVRSYNSVGFSAWTPYVCATTLTVPAAPSGQTATAISGSQIRINWVDNSNNEGGFEVNNGTTTVWVGANSRSYTWGGLANGKYMCFRIRSYNSVGFSAWTPYVCATTKKVKKDTLNRSSL